MKSFVDKEPGSIVTILQTNPSFRNWRSAKTGKTILQTALLQVPSLALFHLPFIRLYDAGADTTDLIDSFNKFPYSIFDFEFALDLLHEIPILSRLALKCFNDLPFICLLINYRDPESGREMAQLALENKHLRTLALFCFLGTDLTLPDDFTFTDQEGEMLRKYASQYPLTKEQVRGLETLLEMTCVIPNA